MSYLGFLHFTGEQQATRLRVEGSGLASDLLVGLPVQLNSTWFTGCHLSGIHTNCHVHPLSQTQIQPGGGGDLKTKSLVDTMV